MPADFAKLAGRGRRVAAPSSAAKAICGKPQLGECESAPRVRESMQSVYLDYNATTPIDEAVIAAMADCYAQGGANPSSPHRAGRQAKREKSDANGNGESQCISKRGTMEPWSSICRMCRGNLQERRPAGN